MWAYGIATFTISVPERGPVLTRPPTRNNRDLLEKGLAERLLRRNAYCECYITCELYRRQGSWRRPFPPSPRRRLPRRCVYRRRGGVASLWAPSARSPRAPAVASSSSRLALSALSNGTSNAWIDRRRVPPLLAHNRPRHAPRRTTVIAPRPLRSGECHHHQQQYRHLLEPGRTTEQGRRNVKNLGEAMI